MAELDALEKELGLSLNSIPKEVMDSLPNESQAVGEVGISYSKAGCIPDNWIYSIFGAALPVEQNCWIWDWLLSKKEKFAGTVSNKYFCCSNKSPQVCFSLPFFWGCATRSYWR